MEGGFGISLQSAVRWTDENKHRLAHCGRREKEEEERKKCKKSTRRRSRVRRGEE